MKQDIYLARKKIINVYYPKNFCKVLAISNREQTFNHFHDILIAFRIMPNKNLSQSICSILHQSKLIINKWLTKGQLAPTYLKSF